MFEKAELRGTPMGPNGPPTYAKPTAEFAPEIEIQGILAAFLVILVILGKTSHFGHFGQPLPS